MGASEYISHVLDAGGDCGKLFEDSTGLFGHNIGKRSLADAGRSKQNNGARRGQRAFGRRIGESAQRRALSQHPRLAHHFVHARRTHAHGQRACHIFGSVHRTKQILSHNFYCTATYAIIRTHVRHLSSCQPLDWQSWLTIRITVLWVPWRRIGAMASATSTRTRSTNAFSSG